MDFDLRAVGAELGLDPELMDQGIELIEAWKNHPEDGPAKWLERNGINRAAFHAAMKVIAEQVASDKRYEGLPPQDFVFACICAGFRTGFDVATNRHDNGKDEES